jgi:hypothetical protein
MAEERSGGNKQIGEKESIVRKGSTREKGSKEREDRVVKRRERKAERKRGPRKKIGRGAGWSSGRKVKEEERRKE